MCQGGITQLVGNANVEKNQRVKYYFFAWKDLHFLPPKMIQKLLNMLFGLITRMCLTVITDILRNPEAIGFSLLKTLYKNYVNNVLTITIKLTTNKQSNPSNNQPIPSAFFLTRAIQRFFIHQTSQITAGGSRCRTCDTHVIFGTESTYKSFRSSIKNPDQRF